MYSAGNPVFSCETAQWYALQKFTKKKKEKHFCSGKSYILLFIMLMYIIKCMRGLFCCPRVEWLFLYLFVLIESQTTLSHHTWCSAMSPLPLAGNKWPVSSVSDPDPAFKAEYWIPIRIRHQSGSRILMTNNWLTAEKKMIIFWSNIAIYLSLGLHKGRPNYSKSFQFWKENIQHFKIWNFLTFSIFVDHFCPPGSRSSDLIESGSSPDPKHYL